MGPVSEHPMLPGCCAAAGCPVPGAQCGFICPGCLSLLGLGSLISLLPFPSSILLGAAILDWEGVWWTELTISLPSLVSPYPAFSTVEIITTRGARKRGDKNQCEFG